MYDVWMVLLRSRCRPWGSNVESAGTWLLNAILLSGHRQTDYQDTTLCFREWRSSCITDEGSNTSVIDSDGLSLSQGLHRMAHTNHVSVCMKGSDVCTSKPPAFPWNPENISPAARPVLHTVAPSGYVLFWLSGAKRCGVWLTLPLVRWHIRAHIKVRHWAGWVTMEGSKNPSIHD